MQSRSYAVRGEGHKRHMFSLQDLVIHISLVTIYFIHVADRYVLFCHYYQACTMVCGVKCHACSVREVSRTSYRQVPRPWRSFLSSPSTHHFDDNMDRASQVHASWRA
jgi:hypothetical protein